MKTAIWLYLFLFIAFFDLHAQYPILTPFAVSLGAAPTFIGWMMGIYSLTHLPGNLLAGPRIDRNGSRRYIMFSLTAAGIVLIMQAYVQSPWELLLLRSISGFVLAFLSPACLALLAQLSANPVTQGKYMSGHGVVHTLASVVSPAAGAFIVASFGFSGTFRTLGIILLVTGIMAFFTIPQQLAGAQPSRSTALAKQEPERRRMLSWRHYLLPLTIACAQGILFYELPLREGGNSTILSTGLLFSIISLGALFTLSMLFINKYSPLLRIALSVLVMALCFYMLAALPSIRLEAVLFVLGMSKGIVFPAMASMFISLGGGKLGRTFALHSIATSIGSFLGPIAAGQLREGFSPYFIAFLILMTGLLFLPRHRAVKPVTLPVSRQA
ncbi:MFS transporter [Paenibacillus sp. JX-17]|uniref:MFS transporter n=1 Tax=Paenibacillus lacisoli TaxID=3064525 RepID=A0ABT9CCT8_9BACL|nr:MFS transporter [Paenibacillus sp. JX-17]MDO7907082.1 MFS transporter [Paenibacillus sp. JX-17]